MSWHKEKQRLPAEAAKRVAFCVHCSCGDCLRLSCSFGFQLAGKKACGVLQAAKGPGYADISTVRIMAWQPHNLQSAYASMGSSGISALVSLALTCQRLPRQLLGSCILRKHTNSKGAIRASVPSFQKDLLIGDPKPWPLQQWCEHFFCGGFKCQDGRGPAMGRPANRSHHAIK